MIELAKQGVASDQDRVQAESNLKVALANVQALKDQVRAAEADLSAAVARTHQANAARSTVESTRAQLSNAEAQRMQATGSPWLYENPCAGEWNGFGARPPAKGKWSIPARRL